MTDKIYLVEVGFKEPTVIYRLVPEKVKIIQGGNMTTVVDELEKLDADIVVVNPSDMDVVDWLRRYYKWMYGRYIALSRSENG